MDIYKPAIRAINTLGINRNHRTKLFKRSDGNDFLAFDRNVVLNGIKRFGDIDLFQKFQFWHPYIIHSLADEPAERSSDTWPLFVLKTNPILLKSIRYG